MTRALVAVVLSLFSYETVAVLVEHGYGGFLDLAQANTATSLLLFDVTIFVVLASVWMARDARTIGRAVPFILVTAGFGAAGPLAYLLARPWMHPVHSGPTEHRSDVVPAQRIV